MVGLFSLALASSFNLLFAGDIMLNGISPKASAFKNIAGITGGADLAFANLEIPLTTSTYSTSRKTVAELKRKSQFVLSANPAHAQWIKAAGFDLLNLANNHAMDRGARGLSEMVKLLDEKGLGHSGAGRTASTALSPATAKLPDGRKIALIGFLAFVTRGALLKCTPATDSSAGVNVLSFGGRIDQAARDKLRSLVSLARSQGDFVVVALHWGVERQTVPSGYQVALGRAFVDAGADVVWGHHPHVLQGAELYKSKPILYSMGNLVSPLPDVSGMIRLSYEDGGLPKANFIPCRIAGGKVSPTPAKVAPAAVKAFRALCSRLLKKYPSARSQPLIQ